MFIRKAKKIYSAIIFFTLHTNLIVGPHVLKDCHLRAVPPRSDRQKEVRYKYTQKYDVVNNLIKTLIRADLEVSQTLLSN